MALGQLGWLGKPVVLDSPSGTALASEIQLDLAAGRSLRHALEHWGESAIISLASRATHLLMLSDDYDARIAAHVNGVEAMSVHKFLHMLIVNRRITAQEAAAFADALHDAGRSPDFTADELRSGRLKRVGEP